MKARLAELRKLLVAVCGGLGLVASTGILSGRAEVVVTSLLAIATAYGVYRAPNDPKESS